MKVVNFMPLSAWPPGYDPSVAIVFDAEWYPEPLRTVLKKGKISVSAEKKFIKSLEYKTPFLGRLRSSLDILLSLMYETVFCL